MTSTTANSLDPQLIASLEGLELRARYIVDGYLSGMHRSAYRGHSAEFAEHREYAPGDDVRYVDWKVFGKTDKVYLKQFEAETNLVCYLLMDVSESMLYQSAAAALSKRQYAESLAMAMAHIVLRQRDSVSLATFDEGLRDLVPESSNPIHWQQLVHVLENTTLRRPSRTGAVLHELSQRLRRRGVVVVLSDLLGRTEGDLDMLLTGLKHLRHQRHEVIVLQVLDPEELDFRFDGTTRFRALESMPDVVVEPRSIRKAYQASLREFLRQIKSGCRAMQIDYQQVRTTEPFDQVLRQLLARRGIQHGK